ncbi:uncharacterized protein [Triticum aestivum]|nr:uncharacterized protein LOC123162654 [Triticum aestivum]
MTACVLMVPALHIIHRLLSILVLQDSDGFLLLVLVVIVRKLRFYRLIGYISAKKSNIVLHFSPATALLVIWIAGHYIEGYCSDGFCGFGWMNYKLILLWFFIYILARLRLPGHGFPYDRIVKVAAQLIRLVLLCLVLLRLLVWFGPMGKLVLLSTLVRGNLQIPMALARIIFSYVWLVTKDIEVHGTENKNVKLAVQMLYTLVMCQGALYMLACILESSSFLYRRKLALHYGLTDKLGMESIDLYYEQAFDSFLQESVFDTTKKMSLVTFAVDSLNTKASREKKCAAVRILAAFLQNHTTSSSNDTKIISLITTSTKAATTLISMLGWTATEDADIQRFATKVTAHLAPNLRIVGIPGTMQKVSLLLDAQDQPIIQEVPAQVVVGNVDNQQITNASSSPIVDNNRRNNGRQQTRMRTALSFLPLDIEGGNAPVMASRSRSYQFLLFLMEGICRFGEHIEKLMSIPHKDSEHNDSLPVLGMQILEGLAHDLHNCAEISRAMELLPKIIGFINCITGTTAVQLDEITTSSLKLVAKLASINGKTGMTLRQEISENPFLFGNLTKILELEANPSYLEQSKLAMYIIAKIAKTSIDKKTRHKIGAFQVIIDKLVKEFLGDDENPLRAEAGEALAMLAMDCPGNCFAMLDETSYDLIGDLANKMEHGQHIYSVASLLQRLCQNSRELVLHHQGPNNALSSTLTVVLRRIVDAEGKLVEALISLASQICRAGIIPHSSANDQAFVTKLVAELNSRKKPSPDEFPDMRRMLVELTLSIVASCPRYALIFSQNGMMEALSNVECYMWLVVPEEQGALCAMVTKAKALIGVDTT